MSYLINGIIALAIGLILFLLSFSVNVMQISKKLRGKIKEVNIEITMLCTKSLVEVKSINYDLFTNFKSGAYNNFKQHLISKNGKDEMKYIYSYSTLLSTLITNITKTDFLDIDAKKELLDILNLEVLEDKSRVVNKPNAIIRDDDKPNIFKKNEYLFLSASLISLILTLLTILYLRYDIFLQKSIVSISSFVVSGIGIFISILIPFLIAKEKNRLNAINDIYERELENVRSNITAHVDLIGNKMAIMENNHSLEGNNKILNAKNVVPITIRVPSKNKRYNIQNRRTRVIASKGRVKKRIWNRW